MPAIQPPLDTPDVPGETFNPAIGNSDIKRIAEAFRENMKQVPTAAKPAPAEPAQSDLAKGAAIQAPPAEKPPETKPAPETKAPEKPADKPNPDQLPTSTPKFKAADWKALENARDSFKQEAEKHRAELEATKKRLSEIENEFGTLKKTLPSEPSEIQKALQEREQLAKEREELLKTVATVNLERSPQFQNWYKTEIDKHLKVALRGIPADKQDRVKDILLNNPTDPELDAILEPLSNATKRLVDGAIAGLESVKVQRDDALAKGADNWKQLQQHEAQEAAKKAEAQKSRMLKIADTALSRARTLSAFQPKDGDAEHNARIAEREAFVKALVLGEIDEETAVAVPAAAVQMLYLKDTVVPALEKRNAELEALVKQLQTASPSIADGRASSSRAKEEPSDGNSFMRRVVGAMKGE